MGEGEILDIIIFVVFILDLVDLNALVLSLEFSALCASTLRELSLLENVSTGGQACSAVLVLHLTQVRVSSIMLTRFDIS